MVYQLLTGGTVDRRLHKLHKQDILQWEDRMKIAVGTVTGLHYLHTFNENGKPFIHGDIKPANILLDINGIPKIGDFGLAREGNYLDAELKVSRVYGTPPYLPIEYILNKMLSTKVDMFSFGIVLLELATGMPAYDNTHKYLSGYVRSFDESREAELMDVKALANHAKSFAIFRCLMRLGKNCSHPDAESRPADMVTVLKELIEFQHKLNNS